MFFQKKKCFFCLFFFATFRVARKTLQTPKLWLVTVATDRDACNACACLFNFIFSVFFFFACVSFHYIFLFFFLLAKKKNKKSKKKNQKMKKMFVGRLVF